MSIEKYLKFTTLQSKIIIFLGILSIFITSDKDVGIVFLLLQFSAYWALARSIQCQVHGGCIFSSWVALVIPIFGLVVSVFYRLSKLKDYKILRRMRIKLFNIFRNNKKNMNIGGDENERLNLNNVVDVRNNSFIKLD